MGFSTKPIIIDAKDHLLGRLSSVVAKSLLLGQRIVIVRCEDIVMSGNFHRSKLKYLKFLRLRCNVRPSKGPYHYRAPSKIFKRVLRGMVPHKLYRGKSALLRLKTFDGVPPPYDKMKRQVIPSALRHLQLKSRRKFCKLGRLSHEVGWQYQSVIEKLEQKRKVNAKLYYERKNKNVNQLRRKAMESAATKIAPFQKIIESYGHR